MNLEIRDIASVVQDLILLGVFLLSVGRWVKGREGDQERADYHADSGDTRLRSDLDLLKLEFVELRRAVRDFNKWQTDHLKAQHELAIDVESVRASIVHTAESLTRVQNQLDRRR